MNREEFQMYAATKCLELERGIEEAKKKAEGNRINGNEKTTGTSVVKLTSDYLRLKNMQYDTVLEKFNSDADVDSVVLAVENPFCKEIEHETEKVYFACEAPTLVLSKDEPHGIRHPLARNPADVLIERLQTGENPEITAAILKKAKKDLVDAKRKYRKLKKTFTLKWTTSVRLWFRDKLDQIKERVCPKKRPFYGCSIIRKGR